MRSYVRSLLIRALVAVLALTLLVPTLPGPTAQVASATSLADELGLDPDYIPPDMGQSALDVFVPETGHSVRGYMLDYWRANGAASVYGNPISEPFGASNGLYSQAFERGIFQFSPHWMWTDDAAVRLMPIGKQEVKESRLSTRTDGRRTGADRRVDTWTPGSESTVRANEVSNEGGRFSNLTGFSISGAFASWYDNHEGWFYMGAPISEPHNARGALVQYFENGMLMQQDGAVVPAPLPRENPGAYGFDTTPVAQDGRPEFSEALFIKHMNPAGVDVTQLTGRKRIDVSISEQMMRVYQGDTLVLETYVSTGLAPNDTEVGNFHVRIKYEKQTMAGFTDGTGEVIGLAGDGGGNQSGDRWEVSDVPNVMYINYEAEAIHGAYWHNNFGQKMSHGCINLPLETAAYMFDFAPLGTAVTVYE
jgi:lipoprotein-anchoring transpeptidase ErfK/SrfK